MFGQSSTIVYADTICTTDIHWKESFAIFPKRCLFTEKRIRPFSKAVKGVRYTRNGEFRETHWTTPEALVIARLRGKT